MSEKTLRVLRSLGEFIDEEISYIRPHNTSDLTNDSNFITDKDSIDSATVALKSATNLVGNRVAAGTYGPSANVTIPANNGTGTINIPYFVVNDQGVVTNVAQRTLRVTSGCSHCSYESKCDYCSKCSYSSCSYN